MINKVKNIEVKRLKRQKMKYREQSIVTNGVDFIAVKYEDEGGGFEFEFNKSMSKEFFRKLKKQQNASNAPRKNG